MKGAVLLDIEYWRVWCLVFSVCCFAVGGGGERRRRLVGGGCGL